MQYLFVGKTNSTSIPILSLVDIMVGVSDNGAAFWTGSVHFPLMPFERSGLAFGFGHRRFACGNLGPVSHSAKWRLTVVQHYPPFSQPSSFQLGAIQIP